MSDSTTKQIERVQALYHLSLAIGNSLDLQQMLAESGSAFFDHFAAYSLGIYQRVTGENGRFQLQEQYTKGRIKRNAAYRSALKQANGLVEQGADALSFVNQREDTHQYGFDLPDYGIMLMLKKGEPLSVGEIDEKRPLFRKLAIAAHDITAQQQTELELRERKERLADLLEYSRGAIGLLNTETGLFESPNKAAQLLYGLSYDELITVGPADLSPEFQPDGRPSVESATEKIAAAMTGVQPPFEWMHINAAGEELPCEITLVGGLSGKRAHLVRFSVNDITERKYAQSQLELQNQALESAAEAVVITKTDGTIEWVNSAFTALTGYTFEEAVGGDPSVLKSGKHGPEFYKDLWDTVLDGRVWQKELTNRRKDGHFYVEEMTITPVRANGKEISHFIAIKRDITERKQAHEALQSSKNRYHTLFDAAADAIELVDAQGILVDCNDVYLQSLGYERDEAVGQHVTRFFTADGANLFKKMYPKLKKKGYVEAETDLVKKDGSTIRVWRKARATYDDDGEMTGIVVYNRDITERQRIEAEIEAHAADLEAVADISTAISAILDTKALLQLVSETTREYFGFYHAHIFLMNQKMDTLILVAGTGNAGRQLIADQHQILLNHPHSIVAEAARIKNGVIVNDVQSKPYYVTNSHLPNTRSEMAIPILSGGQVLGVLDVQSDQIDYFSREVLNIQTTLASQVAVALQNANQYSETQEALAATESLLRITRTASGTLDLNVMLDDVLEQVLAVTGFDAGLFTTVNVETGSLALQAYRIPEEWVVDIRAGGLDDSLCDLVYRGNAPIILADMAKDSPVDAQGMLADGYQSYQGVPLVAHGNVLGTLCLFGKSVLSENQADVAWLAAVGNQIGFAIQNARLFEQSEAAVADLDILTRRLTREGWDSYLQTQAETLTFSYDSGVVVEDAAAETAVSTAITTPITPYEQPLLVYGEKIGNLSLFSNDDDSEWDDETAEIITAVVAQLTARIENLRLTDETQRALSSTEAQAKRLTAINQAAQAISQESDMFKMLEVAYHQLQQIMPINSFFIGLHDKEANTITMPAIFENEYVERNVVSTLLTTSNSYSVIHSGQPALHLLSAAEVAMPGVSSLGDTSKQLTASQLYVPLQAGASALGILSAQAYALNAYTESDVELVYGVANYVAVALENIRLFSETEDRAEQLATINRVAQTISEQLDLEQMLEAVYIELANVLPRDTLFVSLYDKEANTIEYPMIFERDHRSSLPAQPLLAASNTRKVIDTGKPVLRHLTQEESQIVYEKSVLDGSILGDRSQDITKSQMYVPMQSGQNILGILSLQSYEFNAYTQADVELVMGIAQYLTIAIENIRLFTDTQMRAAQLEKLAEIESALSQAKSESELIQALALFADEEQAITLHYVEDSDDETPVYAYTVAHWENGENHPEDKYMMKPFPVAQHAGTVIGLRHPDVVTFIADIEQDERMNAEAIAEAKRIGYGAVAIVPMRSAGRWQGFISLKWPQTHQFTSDELFLWEQLREPVGAVVAGRRAFMAQQGTLREAEALYEAGEKLNAASVYNDVLDVMRDYTLAGKGAQNISLNYFSKSWIGDDMPEEVYVLARRTANVTEAKFQYTASNYRLHDFPSARQLLQRNVPVLVEDVATDPRFDNKSRDLYLNVFGAVSTIFVPLVTGGQWFGYISAIYQQATEFPEAEVRRLMVLAGQAAVSIQSIHLLDETAQRAQREQTLRQITERVRSSANVETVLQTAVQELSQALGRRAFIQLTPKGIGEAKHE